MNLPTPSTFTRKPGFAPFGLPMSTSQLPSAEPCGSRTLSPHGPRTTSSGVIGALPIRFVNHAESATSSIEFTLALSPAGSTAKNFAAGRNTMLSAPSQRKPDSYSSGMQILWFGGSLGSGFGSGRQLATNG